MEDKTIFDAIKKLKNEAPISRLVAVGLVTPKAMTYFEIAEKFNEIDKRLTRTSKCMKVSQVAETFKCSTVTVYRAIHVMKQPLIKGNVKSIR